MKKLINDKNYLNSYKIENEIIEIFIKNNLKLYKIELIKNDLNIYDKKENLIKNFHIKNNEMKKYLLKFLLSYKKCYNKEIENLMIKL